MLVCSILSPWSWWVMCNFDPKPSIHTRWQSVVTRSLSDKSAESNVARVRCSHQLVHAKCPYDSVILSDMPLSRDWPSRSTNDRLIMVNLMWYGQLNQGNETRVHGCFGDFWELGERVKMVFVLFLLFITLTLTIDYWPKIYGVDHGNGPGKGLELGF